MDSLLNLQCQAYVSSCRVGLKSNQVTFVPWAYLDMLAAIVILWLDKLHFMLGLYLGDH